MLSFGRRLTTTAAAADKTFSQCRCCRLCQFKIDGTLLTGNWYTGTNTDARRLDRFVRPICLLSRGNLNHILCNLIISFVVFSHFVGLEG